MLGVDVEEVIFRILEESGGVVKESSIGRVGVGRLRDVGVDLLVDVE